MSFKVSGKKSQCCDRCTFKLYSVLWFTYVLLLALERFIYKCHVLTVIHQYCYAIYFKILNAFAQSGWWKSPRWLTQATEIGGSLTSAPDCKEAVTDQLITAQMIHLSYYIRYYYRYYYRGEVVNIGIFEAHSDFLLWALIMRFRLQLELKWFQQCWMHLIQ